jgi:hypothetical protein
MPERIQRRRTKGWKMPPGAVYVGRPTVFGNPWSIKDVLKDDSFVPEEVPAVCFKEFRGWVERGLDTELCNEFPVYESLRPKLERLLAELPTLRGKDLACWCPLGSPCHADVLLELANA